MKKFLSVILAVLIVLMLAGCDSWLSGSYASVKPHEEYSDEKSRDSLEVSNITELQTVLEENVAKGTENCVIYVTGIAYDQLENVMDEVTRYVREDNPIGAYAVETINYEIGTSTGRTAIAVTVTYNRTRSEILRIEHTQNMDEAMAVIAEALDECKTGVVVYVEDYKDIDITQKIQDYADAHPDVCMEMPQVSAAVYPNTGAVRVLELVFTYQTNRDNLRIMQTYVQPVFRAAYLNVSGEEEESVKFSRMYAFLMERNDYVVETSITPAYSLLRHGVGDSKAFATVYAAMCTGAGLDCQVISGTRSGEPWVWNLICEDGVYYHVDLLRSNAAGNLLRLSDDDMSGYVWDFTAYAEAERPVEPSTAHEASTPSQQEATPAEEVIPAEETMPVEETEYPEEIEPTQNSEEEETTSPTEE